MNLLRALLGGVLLLALAPAMAQKRIAFSFDDVPRQAGAFFTPDGRSALLIAQLRQAGIAQAGFFVTTAHLDTPWGAGGEARIAAYVAAGHVIANHSHSHPWLHRMAVPDYLADLDRAERWLAGRPGHRPWFRFPYLDEGRRDAAKRDALRAALRQRGLANAYVTVDNYDWHLDDLTRRAVQAGEVLDLETLRRLYVETLVDAVEFYDALALRTLGRSPAHVLLLHETDLAALFIADVAAALKARGWEPIAIDEAYRDPIAAQEPDTLVLGMGRIAALAHAAGAAPATLAPERLDELLLTRLFDERVRTSGRR